MNYSYTDLASVPFFHPLGLLLLPVVFALIIWTLIIKGFALWKAARAEDKVWFVILLVVNTLGILEIIYLLWINKDRTKNAPPAPVAENTPTTIA